MNNSFENTTRQIAKKTCKRGFRLFAGLKFRVEHLKWLLVLTASLLPIPPGKARADALDHWTRVPLTKLLGSDGVLVGEIAYGNGRYVAVGQYYFNDMGFYATSEDGLNWQAATPGAPLVVDLYSVAYGNGVFVAVGWDWWWGGNLWSSADGFHWTRHTNPTVSNFYDVSCGAGLFVAVGDGVLPQTNTTTNRNIYTSPDGAVWTQRSCGVPAAGARPIQSVAYGPGKFIAVDQAGTVYTSSSGASWSRPVAGSAYWPVSFCRDRFIARQQSGTNIVSADGLMWSVMVKNVTNSFGRVHYDRGLFLALSEDKLFTSVDATNWVERPVTLSASTGFSDIALGDRNAVLLGCETPQRVPVAYTSDPFVALEITRGSPAELILSGLQGASYEIEYSDNLQAGNVDWQPLIKLALTNSPLSWSDSTATGSQRFYRAVMLP